MIKHPILLVVLETAGVKTIIRWKMNHHGCHIPWKYEKPDNVKGKKDNENVQLQAPICRLRLMNEGGEEIIFITFISVINFIMSAPYEQLVHRPLFFTQYLSFS